MTSFFSAEDGPIWLKFRRRLVQNDMSTAVMWSKSKPCRITIWRTFGRIQSFNGMSSQRPHITLQGAATWWIHCHDSRAKCHIAGCSHLAKSWSCHIAGCKNSIRHIENRFSPYFIFLFLMQFRLWRAAAFVPSPIHLLVSSSLWQTDRRTDTPPYAFANVAL